MAVLLFLATLLAVTLPAKAFSACTLPNATIPCPSPNWEPVWQLNLSTICQPCAPRSTSPYWEGFSFSSGKTWGLVSLDWSVGEGVWLNPDRSKSTCEATSTANARSLKQDNPGTRVFIYHNMELALEWLESQRTYMYDPTKSDLFLKWPNGSIYNEPRAEGDQFFWDYRNPAAAEAVISTILKVTDNQWVDGTFTDDVSGIPSEHPEVQKNCNLTDAEAADLQEATQRTSQALVEAMVANGKYVWQALSQGNDDLLPVGMGPTPTAAECKSYMRRMCEPAKQKLFLSTHMYNTSAVQTVAAFLVVRPPLAWLGYGIAPSGRPSVYTEDFWSPLFDTDVGVPEGLCHESSPGIFTRAWSKGNATLDCNTWTGTLPRQPHA